MTAKYTHIDLSTSKIEAREADGTAFLENYLRPAYKRMGAKRRGRPTVVIHDGLAVTFSVDNITFHSAKTKPTEIWRLRIGKALTESQCEDVAGKILAAFVAWGYHNAWGFWVFSDGKPFMLEVHLPGVVA